MDGIIEGALGFIRNILPLIFMLGVLVFVHEFGHFLVAKRSGVKVMKFSIGFGPRIFGWTRGETEYVVSWIPLGGYVKMLGENPGEEIAPEDKGRTLNGKPFPIKAGIVFAGPAMNLLLPILLFMVMFFIGYPELTAEVGTIEDDSVAAEAGIEPGDRIVAINGEPTAWWEEVSVALLNGVGKPVRLRLAGPSGEREVTVVPKEIEITTILGDQEKVGAIGITPVYAPSVAAVSRLDSPAAKAGVRTGDKITLIGDATLRRRMEFAPALRKAFVPLPIVLERDGEQVRGMLPPLGGQAELAALTDEAIRERAGLEDPELFIRSVENHSPASEAGMVAGDRLLAVNGEPIESWRAFTKIVLESEGKPLSLLIRRDGLEKSLDVTPGLRFNRDPLAEQSKTYYVGIGSLARHAPGTIGSHIVRNPIKAFMLSVKDTWRMCRLVTGGLWKLLSGQVRIDNIGGPIQIGIVAAQAADEGISTFIRMMAFISINLGILNLLPIPILDGGHLLFFIIEGLKRGPISLRKKELAQQVGLTMLLLLIGVAFYNDIARSWSQIVGFLKDVGTGLM